MLQSLVVQIRTKLKENADKSLRWTVENSSVHRVFFNSDIAIIDAKVKNIEAIK